MRRLRHLGSRRLDQRGMVLSSPVALLSAFAVVAAGVAFVTTGPPPADDPSVVPAAARPEVTPTRTAPEPVIRAKKKPAKAPAKPPKPVVSRAGTYVEVYNNSGISGLAGTTAARAQGAGWQVVGSDNWYGTIAASTVYHPPRLTAAAELLAKDLGIARVQPAISGPMRLDRLTVILTSDYTG